MLNITTIFRKLEKKFQIHINRINTMSNPAISNCMLLPKGSTIPSTIYEHCLYLLEEIPQTTSLEDIEGTMNILLLKPSDSTLSPSICSCSREINLQTAYDFLMSELYEHLRFLDKKEELIKTVQSNFGLDALMKQAYKYMNHPIYLCNFAFQVISFYPAVNNQDLIANSEYGIATLKEDFCAPNSIQEFIDKILQYPMPFITPHKATNIRLLFSSVRSRSTAICFLCVQESKHKFREEDIEYIDMLSQMVAIELQKSYASLDISRDHRQEDFLIDLVKDKFDSSKAICQRMKMIGFTEKLFKWLIVIKLHNHQRKNILWLCGQLKTIFHKHTIAVYESTILILLTQDESNPLKEEEEKLFLNFLTSNKLQAALSNQFTELSHTKEYYEQARNLMKKLPTWFPNVPFVSSAECDIKLLLSLSSQASSLRCYIHPDIKFLNYYDRTCNTNYLETIKAYLRSNRNALQAAKFLNIHKSTFFYRISKINELIEFSLEDSTKLLSYEMSLYIMEFLQEHHVV